MPKEYTYICPECGKSYTSFKNKRKLTCEICLKKARDKKEREKIKSLYRKSDYNQHLFNDVAKVDRYNAEHNTHLSYGQFKLMELLKSQKNKKI